MPFVDSANVAYSGEVLHDLWRGNGFFKHWYALRPRAVSHLAFYGAYHVLRYALPPSATVKVLATLSVFAPALAARCLIRQMNLSPWLALPGVALGFNTNLGMGFLPFALGIFLLPTSLLIIEKCRCHFRWWMAVLLGCLLGLSPFFHYLLTALLIPIAMLWSVLSLRGKERNALLLIEIVVGGSLLELLKPDGRAPPFRDIVGWTPFLERWNQLNGDLFKWTTDGAPTLSLPWLLLAFVSSLLLSRATPVRGHERCAGRAPTLLLILYLGYMLGPSTVSWPEPAWGLGARIAIVLAFSVLLVPTTAAVGWSRFFQHSPWVAFTFWHLCSLIEPFTQYARLVEPLKALALMVPRNSTVLPVFGAKEIRNSRYSFGGFAGASALHVAKWLSVETQSYQPWSFCDAAYHPMRCTSRLPASNESQPFAMSAESVKKYDFVVSFENSSPNASHWQRLPLKLLHKKGAWSLWRIVR